jgi:prepilin-type processing-associated H-X9-DG protein
VTVIVFDDGVYNCPPKPRIVGMNRAVNILFADCNVAVVVAVPLLVVEGGPVPGPVIVTLPIAVAGVTLAVRVTGCPITPLGGDAVSIVVVAIGV